MKYPSRQIIIDKTLTAGETPEHIYVGAERSLAIQTNYDVAIPAAKTFDTGAFEVDTLTFADKATSANGDYIAITDTNGDKWAVALSKAGIAEVTSITTIGEGSVKEQTQLVAVAEGSVKNVTQVVVTADVSGSLSGDYFVVRDGGGTVGVWFSVDGVPAAAPAGALACTRQVEVPVSEDDTDLTVGAAVTTAFTLDAGLVVGNVGAIVTITDVAFGARAVATDGVAPNNTGFSILNPVPGVNSSYHGKYFILKDEVGTVGFWFDVDDAGSSAPVTGAARNVEIATLTSGMTAGQVGTAIYDAIHTDTKFNGVSDDTAGTIIVISTTYGNKTGQVAGTSPLVVTESLAGSTSALQGKYFKLADVDGVVTVWFDVGNVGTSQPAVPGTNRYLEVTTIALEDTAAQVAAKLRTAIDADSKFDVGTLTDATFNAVCKDLKAVTDSAAGDSGFTLSTVTQGSDLGLAPTGLVWLSIAANKKAQSDISGATTAANVATAVRATLAAITGIGTVITVGAASGADIPLTHKVKGPVANPVPKNTGDTGVGTITVAESLAGAVTEVSVANDTVTIPNHGFTNGAIVTLTTTGTLPAGLATSTDYTILVKDANTIQFLNAGELVDITDEGVSGSVNTVTHTALVGASVQYQKSCDAVNWVNEGSAITITVDGTNMLELDDRAYPYLRAVISLTSGVLGLEIIVCGL